MKSSLSNINLPKKYGDFSEFFTRACNIFSQTIERIKLPVIQLSVFFYEYCKCSEACLNKNRTLTTLFISTCHCHEDKISKREIKKLQTVHVRECGACSVNVLFNQECSINLYLSLNSVNLLCLIKLTVVQIRWFILLHITFELLKNL